VGSGGGGGVSKVNWADVNCTTVAVRPQPAKSDPVWQGHTQGVVMAQTCPVARGRNEGIYDVDFTTVQFWSEDGDPGDAPRVTPQELAQRALSTLRLPKPEVHRSPSESNADRGMPFTWINVPTWFWTGNGWSSRSKTARAGAVWARVTVTPSKLVVKAGDGSTEQCEGPGRAWRKSDANDAPDDACIHIYRRINDAVKPTVSIQWTVSWRGSGATGADLPMMTTTTTQNPMRVEQIQTVVAR
jgi:hypothetical protein